MENCLGITSKHLTENRIQGVHLSFPCNPFSVAGVQRGRGAREANLLEPVASEIRQAYDGRGVPWFTFENVLGVETLLFDNFEEGFGKVFPEYHIKVHVIAAAVSIRLSTRRIQTFACNNKKLGTTQQVRFDW